MSQNDISAESHGIRNMLHLRLPNDLHVLPSLHQTRRRKSRPLRLSILFREHTLAHVVHVSIGTGTTAQEHVRREAMVDFDRVFGVVDVFDCDLFYSHTDGT